MYFLSVGIFTELMTIMISYVKSLPAKYFLHSIASNGFHCFWHFFFCIIFAESFQQIIGLIPIDTFFNNRMHFYYFFYNLIYRTLKDSPCILISVTLYYCHLLTITLYHPDSKRHPTHFRKTLRSTRKIHFCEKIILWTL